MRIRTRRRRGKSDVDVSLTPLIDTALTLLIIFMIATPMMQNSIRINLPKGKVKDDSIQKESTFVVYINEGEQFFVGQDQIERGELISKLTDIVKKDNETIYVKADQSVSYGIVLEMVDEIKMIPGVASVALATQIQGP